MLERKVVFATDLTGAVGEGLALATSLAQERSATLAIIHVVALRRQDGVGMLHSAIDLMHDDAAGRLRSLIPADPRVPFVHVVEVGDPHEKIAAYVEREPVDLLVMEATSRPFFQRLWAPDLPNVLRSTIACPMLTYRGDPTSPALVTERKALTDMPFEALAVTLDARVDALTRWMSAQRDTVASIAERASIRDGVASLVRGSGIFARRVRQLLELELEEQCMASGARGYEIIVDGEPVVGRGWTAAHGDARRELLARATREGAAVSLPLEPDDTSEVASHVILAAAVVKVPGGPPGLLVVTHDARQSFIRILAQPGPTPTAETYAFDAEGMMLSHSRFPDHLRRIGLLPAKPGVQALGRVRVCDPGDNLLTSSQSIRGPLPLTRMATSAIAGESGSDWHGYRDYRGVEVVGTWRWVAEHGFGVAAEMDRP